MAGASFASTHSNARKAKGSKLLGGLKRKALRCHDQQNLHITSIKQFMADLLKGYNMKLKTTSIKKTQQKRKKEASKQTKNGRRNLRIQQILSSVWKCTKTKILIQ